MLPCLSLATAGGSDQAEETAGKREVVGRTGQPLGIISERDLPLPCPAQPKVAALRTMHPAARNAWSCGHSEYGATGSASGFCQLQGAEPGKAWVACTGARNLGRRV